MFCANALLFSFLFHKRRNYGTLERTTLHSTFASTASDTESHIAISLELVLVAVSELPPFSKQWYGLARKMVVLPAICSAAL